MLELKTISHEVGAIHITSREDYMQFLSEMQSIVDERHRKYEEEKLQNPSLIPGDFYSKMEPVLILIADLEVFTGNIGILNDLKIWRMIMNLEEVNVTIVASVLASKLKGIDELTKAMKQSVYGIVTGSASAQMQFTIPRAMTVNEKVGIGYKVERGRPEQILIPLL